MENVNITTESIKLQDVLKLASLVPSGGAAKIAVELGDVTLNGAVCLQRGRQVRPGDVVGYRGHELTVRHADR